MAENKRYACILGESTDPVLYSAGYDRETLTEGLTDNDSYTVVPCTQQAMEDILRGNWQYVEFTGDQVRCGEGNLANANRPVVRCLIEGRDY